MDECMAWKIYGLKKPSNKGTYILKDYWCIDFNTVVSVSVIIVLYRLGPASNILIYK